MNFDIDAYQDNRLNQHLNEQDRLEKLDEELEEFIDGKLQELLKPIIEELIEQELSSEHLEYFKRG